MLKRLGIIALVLALASCGFFRDENGGDGGDGNNGGTPARFAYVANLNGQAISGFSINAGNGQLAPLAQPAFPGPVLPIALRVSNDGTLLFVADQFSGVLTFSIDRNTGGLQPLGVTQAGSGPSSLAYTGPFLYVLNRTSNNISGFAVNTNGTLSALGGFPVAVAAASNTIRTDRSGRLLYVAAGAAGTHVFTIAADGRLQSTRTVPAEGGTTARDVAISPDARFAYVANGSTGVEAYAVNANNGDLTRIAGSPFAAGTTPAELVVDPQGRFVYVTNEDSGNVSAFAIQTDGTLSPVSGTPFAAGTSPAGITVDQSGQFVYVTNFDENSVSMYRIGSNGALLSEGKAMGFANPVAVITTR